MMARRGDFIPPVSDYAHWNEDAQAMWYAENKYDMDHADEYIEDPDDDNRGWGYDDDEGYEEDEDE
jgi:hypothetical protein